ncbi:MAG: S-layer homology domain-containing protein [Clostridia bacterium]
MAEDQVLYTEQCMTDKNGAFILTMVMPQGTTAGAYPIYLQAGAMTEPVRKTLELDFTAAEPAVTDLSVSGTVFVGEPVAAQYVYTHMAAVDEGDSEIIWYAADTADAPFTEVIPGATGKTLSLPEAYAYRYIGYQVTPKTIGGVTGETVTSGAFRVYARPTVTGVTLQTENGALVVNYSYSHIRGYGEKNHRFQWFKSAAADGDYTEISGVDSARYQPAASDSGSYFKVIMTPGADVPADEAAAAYGNPTESTACLWKGGSSTGGTTGNKNTGATGRGGGSSTLVSGKPSDPVTPSSDGNKTFSDVPADHWAKAAIDRLQAMGIVSGVSDSSFEPNRPVTRAEFIKMLLLAMGLAPKAYDGSFSDVTADAWYAGFVQAAYENGLADGSDGAFMPDQRISREAMAKMLVTAYENLRGTVAAETAGFTDSEAFSDWAAPYIHKAVAAGLMQGMDDGSFNGRGAADRAQVAAVIARFYDGAVKGGNSQ